MQFPEIAQVLSITVISFLIGLALKAYKRLSNDWIPVLVCLAGGILGVTGLYIIPDYPANNVIDAFAVGIVSGLASTGVHQVYTRIGGVTDGSNKNNTIESEELRE